MALNWYVVKAMSGQERKVKSNLEARIQVEELGDYVGRVLIPTENVSEVKSGKRKITSRLFFPGYILVEMELNERTYLDQIEAKKEKVKPKVLFEVGEAVKVTEGPFVNFNGVINEINPDKGKLKVMVSIFGRSTPLELEYWQVERT